MFGLFGSREDAQKAYEELLACLTDDWEMKGRFAAAFLEVYRRSIAKIYSEVMKRYGAIADSGNAELQLMTVAMGGKSDAMDHMLVAQAYRGYKEDLRRGRYVGTDIEKAIWGIFLNRSDILEQLDKSLARYVDMEHATRFPNLLEEVFRSEDRRAGSAATEHSGPGTVAVDEARSFQKFFCPECGSHKEGAISLLGNVLDMFPPTDGPSPKPNLEELRRDPWFGITQIIYCAHCGTALPAHIASVVRYK